VKAYPKLHALIQECWRVRRKERPTFDEIVHRLQDAIGDEIKHREEPEIVLYSVEDDLIYRNRIGKEDEIEESDEEDQLVTARQKTTTMRREHEKIVAAKDKAMAELQKKMKKVQKELKEKVAKEKELEQKLEKALGGEHS
jgi:hypothetical protein